MGQRGSSEATARAARPQSGRLSLAAAPSLRGLSAVDRSRSAGAACAGLTMLPGALLLGLVANACQDSLCRLLAGHLVTGPCPGHRLPPWSPDQMPALPAG
ncbi:hypothetical protein GCM10023083_40880 [Streptomyces phyllanthi]